MRALQDTAQQLSEEDLREISTYAEYLVTKQMNQESHIHVNELVMQHEENSRLLITFILQRSRLISILTHLADIIVRAATIGEQEKHEAQTAMQTANWIFQRGNTSDMEE